MIDFFFHPKGVAVVGATPEESTGGYYLLANLTLGYPGPIYPVNPKYDEILGLKCYPRVSEIEGPLDLALIFVPARAVPNILEDCVSKGIRGAIIESSGFAEVGPEGRALQDECMRIARRGRIRLWGPNCIGLIDTSMRRVFSFLIPDAWEKVMNPGGVSLIVQSGLLAAGFITTLMGNKTLALAKVCSIGNKCDVEETEVLEYLLEDPATKVVALYLESFIHGRRFFDLCASSKKPVVLLKGGKTSSGAEASISHTASLAGNNELIGGVLRQAGVHQADDLFQMVDIARALERGFPVQRPPGDKPRIAIFSFSGAAGIVTTDQLDNHGLTLARLSTETRRKLEELSPAWMPVKNPVDYWPAIEKNGPVLSYKHAIRVLHDAPEVDGLIVHLFAGFGIWFLDMKAIMSVIETPQKPILFWLMGPEEGREATRLSLEQQGWPTFNEIGRTVQVMASLFEQSMQEKRLESPSSGFSTPSGIKTSIREAGIKGISAFDELQAKSLLRELGLRTVDEQVVRDPEEAAHAAEGFGFPVALKGIVEGKVHKTEAGLVRLNLFTSEQVTSACQEMSRPENGLKSFIVQPMLKGDIELIVGMIRDPQFGPAAMLGLGGIWTEVFRDTAFRLVPLNRQGVLEMVGELRGSVLFKGFRGSKPVDMTALADWLIRLGSLVLEVGEIQEIDVNPLLIVDGDPVAVDAKIILG